MTTSQERPLQIAFLLGKPVRNNTVFPEVFERLRKLSATTAVYLPKGDEPLPAWVFDSDLVVQRGLGARELAIALALEEAGIRCCNSISGTIDVGNRAAMSRKLADAELPVPKTTPADTWPDVLSAAAGQPVVVKAADGSVGRGLGVQAWVSTSPQPANYRLKPLSRDHALSRNISGATDATTSSTSPDSRCEDF